MIKSKSAAVIIAWAAATTLFSSSLKAQTPTNTVFNLDTFLQQTSADVPSTDLQQTIVAAPVCVDHQGLSGELFMETPKSSSFPISVTTQAGHRNVSYPTITEGTELDKATMTKITDALSAQAKRILAKLSYDCIHTRDTQSNLPSYAHNQKVHRSIDLG